VAPRVESVPVAVQADGEYDSEFPNLAASQALEEISQAVKQINSVAFYKSYHFPSGLKIQNARSLDSALATMDNRMEVINNSVYGTATIIQRTSNKILFLTSAHVVSAPDTIRSYWMEGGQEFLEGIAVKLDQTDSVLDLPGIGSVEVKILKIDAESDIALLAGSMETVPDVAIPVFNYPIGRSSELRLGSFVYLIGYPMGLKMVTSGLVSTKNYKKTGSFLIDVPFNEGMSGGIILALRDGPPHFELVGLAKSVSANRINVLTPRDERGLEYYSSNYPYEGDTYVKQLNVIHYGVSFTTSSEEILRFFKENEKSLLKQGFDLRSLY
jgi:S1-C subfamily serine protease